MDCVALFSLATLNACGFSLPPVSLFLSLCISLSLSLSLSLSVSLSLSLSLSLSISPPPPAPPGCHFSSFNFFHLKGNIKTFFSSCGKFSGHHLRKPSAGGVDQNWPLRSLWAEQISQTRAFCFFSLFDQCGYHRHTSFCLLY